jgi:hypothetical protein
MALPSSGGVTGPSADAFLSTPGGEAATANLGGSGPTGDNWPTFDNLAFDKSGNLWVLGQSSGALDSPSYLAQIPASALASLASNATPSLTNMLTQPAAQASMGATYFSLAFDATGALWLGSDADLYRFVSEADVPNNAYDLHIANVPFLAKSLAINPIPAGLPISP